MERSLIELEQSAKNISNEKMKQNIFDSINSLRVKNYNRMFFEDQIKKQILSINQYNPKEDLENISESTVLGNINIMYNEKQTNEEKVISNDINAYFDAFVLVSESNIQLLAPLIDEVCFGVETDKETRDTTNLYYAAYGKDPIIKKLETAELKKIKSIIDRRTQVKIIRDLNFLRKNSAHVQNIQIEFIKNKGYDITVILKEGKKGELIEFCQNVSKSIDDFIIAVLKELNMEIKKEGIPIINKKRRKNEPRTTATTNTNQS